jgi:N-acetylmuramoyl-L-alanine amidase
MGHPASEEGGVMAELGPIRYLTIHCAATPEGRNVLPQDIEAWDVAKFKQRSYHWIVPLEGPPHRSLKDDVLGAHVHLANHGNIGVCYVGGVDAHGVPKDTRTTSQRAYLRMLVEQYRSRYPNLIVRGHRDWPGVAKACPSFDVATEL